MIVLVLSKRALSLQTKIEVLKAVDSAPLYKKKKGVATDFNILKTRDTIRQAYEQQTVSVF
ncbi:UNVERIFIED_CONTAM: hypothetical protein FKN15_010566 [Acipenser sinensis]